MKSTNLLSFKYLFLLRVGIISSIDQITKKIMNFAIKITLSNCDSLNVQLSYRVGQQDSMSPDVIYRFNSINQEFSIIFGFKTIIFAKFIVYYCFLSFSTKFFIIYYQISIGFLSNFYRISIKFYRFRTI